MQATPALPHTGLKTECDWPVIRGGSDRANFGLSQNSNFNFENECTVVVHHGMAVPSI